MAPQEQEVPLIIQALGFLLGFVNLVLCLPALPVCALCKFTQDLVSNEGLCKTWIETRLRDYVYYLWFPRFLVTIGIIGVFIGEVVAVVLIAAKVAHLAAGAQAGVGVGASVLLLYGSTLGAHVGCLKFEVKKQFSGMLTSFLDAGTFFVAVFTTMCLVRAPALCAMGEDQRQTWRRFVVLQLFLTAADMLLLPFVACLVMFPWRMALVVASWKKHKGNPTRQRLSLLEQWVQLLVDLPLLLGFVPLVFNPPRLFMAVRDVGRMFVEVKPEFSDTRRRLVIIYQLGLTVLDPFALFARVLVFITRYRETQCSTRLQQTYGFYMRDPLLIPDPDPAKSAAHRFSAHLITLSEGINVVIDLPFVVLGLIVVLTGWRTSHFIKRYREEQQAGQDLNFHRKLCFQEFWGLVFDVPFLFLSLFVFGTLYRGPTLFGLIRRNEVPESEGGLGKHFNHRRTLILTQFCNILLDIPFVFLAFAACLTGVRIYAVLRDLCKNNTASGRRRAVAQQFFLALCDIPCLFFAVVLFITQYRWSGVYDRLKDPLTVGPFSPWPFPPGSDAPEKVSVVCCCGNTSRFQSHGIVARAFLEVIVDIPFLLCFGFLVMTVIRLPTTYRHFKAIRATPAPYSARLRQLVAVQLCNTLIDIPICFIGGFVFVFGFYGRGYKLVRDLCRLSRPVPPPPAGETEWPVSSFRWCVFKNLALILLDVPTIFCGALVIITGYRVSRVRRKMAAGHATFFAEYSPTMSCGELTTPHCIVMREAVGILFDLPFFAMGAFCCMLVWRAIPLLRDLFHLRLPKADGTFWGQAAYRWCVVHHFLRLFFDVPAIFCGAVICVTIYRLNTLKRKLAAEEGFLALYNPGTSLGVLLKPHCTVYEQGIELLLDLPFFAMGAFCCMLVWRAIPLLRDLFHLRLPKADGTFWGQAAYRWCVVHHFLRLFFDVPAMFCGAVICVTVYRLNTLKRRLAEENGFLAIYDPATTFDVLIKPHIKVFSQFGSLLVDLPFIAVGGFVCLFPWRNWILLRDIYHLANSADDAGNPWPAQALRLCALSHFVLLFLDVPTIFCGLLVCVTIYRVPTTRKLIATQSRGFLGKYDPLVPAISERLPHFIVIIQALQVILDLPFLFMGTFVMLTLWRAPSLYYELTLRIDRPDERENSPTYRRRKGAARQLLLLFLDLAVVPFLIITLLTLVRFMRLLRQLIRVARFYTPILCFQMMCCDAQVNRHLDNARNDVEMGEVQQQDENDAAPRQSAKLIFSDDFLWHQVIMDEFMQLVVDGPFGVLFLILVVGPPALIYFIHTRSEITPVQFPKWLVALLGILIGVPWIVRMIHFGSELALTFKFQTRVQRERSWYEFRPNYDWAPSRRLLIVQHTAMIFLDIPAVMGALIVLFTQYRLIYTARCVKLLWQGTKLLIVEQFREHERELQQGEPEFNAEWFRQHRAWGSVAIRSGISFEKRLAIHMKVISQGVAVLVDLPFICCGVLVMATLWRTKYFVMMWRQNTQKYRENNKLFTATIEDLRGIVYVPPPQQIVNFELCEMCGPLDVASCERCLAARPVPPPSPPPPPPPKDLLVWMRELCEPFDNLVSQQRTLCIWNALLLCIDLPVVIVCGSLLLVTLYRVPDVVRKMGEIPVSEPDSKRRLLLKQTCGLLKDLPFIVLGFFLLPTVYRGLALIYECVYYAKTAKARRSAVLQQWGMLLMDLFALACLPFLILTLYRIPRVIGQIQHPATVPFFNWYGQHQDRVEVQLIILANFFLLIVDIPFMVLTLLIVGTLWRAPSLLSKLWKGREKWPCTCNFKRPHFFRRPPEEAPAQRPSPGLLALPSAVLEFSVVPYLDPKALCMFSEVSKIAHEAAISKRAWKERFMQRYPTALTGVMGLANERRARIADLCEDGTEWKQFYGEMAGVAARPVFRVGSREIILREFGSWLIDLPFLVLAVVPLLSVVRTVPLLRDLACQCHSAGHRRRAVWQQTLLTIADVITFPVLLVLVATLYRLPSLYICMRLRSHSYFWVPYQPHIGMSARLVGHDTVFAQFCFLLLDLPFIALALLPLLSGIRTIPLLIDLVAHCQSAAQRRSAVWQQTILLLADIIAFPAMIPVIVTVYRFPVLWEDLKNVHFWLPYQDLPFCLRLTAHRAVLNQFGGLLVDMPFNVMGLVASVLPHRAYLICNDMRGKRWSYGEHRMICFAHFFKALFDIPFILLGAFVCLFPWRVYAMCKLIGARRRSRASRGENTNLLYLYNACDVYRLVLLNIFLIPLDLLSILAGSLVLLCLWRLPTFKALIDRRVGLRSSLVRTVYLMLRDVVMLMFLLPFIILGIQRLPSAYRNTKRLVRRYRRETRDGVNPVITPVAPDVPEDASDEDGLRIKGPKSFAMAYANFADKDIPAENNEGISGCCASCCYTSQPRAPAPPVEMNPPGGAPITPVAAPVAVDEERQALLMEIDGMLRCGKVYLPATTPMPLSLSLLQPLWCHEAALSIARFHHILLAPIRLCSIPLFPFYWYIGWRLKPLDITPQKAPEVLPPPGAAAIVPQGLSEEQQEAIKRTVSMSFYFGLVARVYALSTPPVLKNWKSLTRLDSFMARTLFVLLPLLLNELGVLFAIPTFLFLLLQCCGLKEDLARNEKTCSMRKALSCITLIAQGLLLPFTLAVLLGFFGFPVILQIVVYGRLMVGWVVVQVVLGVALLGALQLSYRFTKKVNYRPFELYRGIWEFAWGKGLPWRMYRSILTNLARCAYFIRRSCDCVGRAIGELLLIVMVLGWGCWPLVPPLLVKETKLYVLVSVPICVCWLWRSRRIVTAAWQEHPVDLDEEDLLAEAQREQRGEPNQPA